MLNHRKGSNRVSSKAATTVTSPAFEASSDNSFESSSLSSNHYPTKTPGNSHPDPTYPSGSNYGDTVSVNSTMSSSSAVAEFDALRREATKLERHLEDKVARYQQLAQRMATGDSFASEPKSSLLDSVESGTLYNGSNHRHQNGNGTQKDNLHEEESTLSSDISRTISAMSDLINNRMSPASEKTGRSQHILLVKRYREILFDCSADFQKTSAAVARRREAMELFTKKDGSMGGGMGRDGVDLETEQLLRERNSIGSSLRAASSVIGQAEEIRGDLRNQGSSLRGTNSTIAAIAGNVPGINHLIDAIRRKRSRDDMIVSGVIAACILFTLWYVFIA